MVRMPSLGDVRRLCVSLASIAAPVSVFTTPTPALAQTLGVYQAEDPRVNAYNTGRLYTDRPISGIYAGSAYHQPGLISRIQGIRNLPANRNLRAQFRLWKASTVYDAKVVALEVFSVTQNRTLAHRVLKNNTAGYYDYGLDFRVMRGEVVELRAYWYSTRGTQVKYDYAYIEQVR